MTKVMSNSSNKSWSTLILKTKTIMKIHSISNLLRDWIKRNNSKLLLKRDWWNSKNSKRNTVNSLMNCKLSTVPKRKIVSLKVTQTSIMAKTKMRIINNLIKQQTNKVKKNWKRNWTRRREHSPKWQMWNLLAWECSTHGMQGWDYLNRRILQSQRTFYKGWKTSKLWTV